MASSPGRRRVLFLGAGHAHLPLLTHAREFARRGAELVVVAPGDFWYSGLATGMLGGQYPPEDDRVDVAALVAAGGGRFVRDRATRLDPAGRTVHRADGPPLAYDLLSCNLGSEVPLHSVPGAAEHGWPVKPIANLAGLRRDLEGRLARASPGRPVRVVVAGGGATACEVAANVARLARARGGAAAVTVLAGEDRVLKQASVGAAAALAAALADAGVTVRTKARVARVAAGAVTTAGGGRVEYDVLVHALGLGPPPLLRASGLPVGEDGSLRVDEYLRVESGEPIFGGGDCVWFAGRALPRVGVYAVRQAPVLLHNLLALLDGRPLRRYRPQRRFLWVMNLGVGTGLAVRGRSHYRGRAALWLKDWLDRRFVRRHRTRAE
jgi:NADH dehydrogenase FAD-containing subunit